MRRSPPQGFARSSRFAGLSRAACAPLPRRPPCEGGGSFRNNSVPEDEPMRNFRSNPAQRRDHYQELTDKIIAALEAGTAPWRRPWDKTACGGATAPVNAATGHRYRGIVRCHLGMRICIVFRIWPSIVRISAGDILTIDGLAVGPPAVRNSLPGPQFPRHLIDGPSSTDVCRRAAPEDR